MTSEIQGAAVRVRNLRSALKFAEKALQEACLAYGQAKWGNMTRLAEETATRDSDINRMASGIRRFPDRVVAELAEVK